MVTMMAPAIASTVKRRRFAPVDGRFTPAARRSVLRGLSLKRAITGFWVARSVWPRVPMVNYISQSLAKGTARNLGSPSVKVLVPA
jgi:hypothetical protein